MNLEIKNRFCKLIDVNTPIIYLQDYDFVRIDELIESCTTGCRKYEWNPATGKTYFETKEQRGNNSQKGHRDSSFYNIDSLVDLLHERLYDDTIASEKDNFIVLKNVHDYINEPDIKTYLQLIAQRRLYGEKYNTTIIIVSPKVEVPQEISKYVSFFDIPFPDEEELEYLIDVHLNVNGYPKEKLEDKDRKDLLQSLKGMTAFEVDRVLDMAMSKDGSLCADDKSMILEQKKQMVKNSGLLELINVKEKLEDIGGLEKLKKYLEKKEKILNRLVEAREAHVATPKGVFIVGMPGCGKSLCAKAAANLFNVPLLKLDMGSMLGKYVGDSESNLRRAIKIAEAAAPCILWIDEIEKGFSGVGGNNDIMTRMFGYFLSWMQDKESSVYVIATANNADSLPPELKRKGRFDEIFCVNLPNKEERKAIFKVHLNRVKAPINEANEEIIKQSEGFNGADIEAVVCEAKEEAFLNSIEGKDDKVDFNSLLLDIAKKTNSISKSCKKQIESMKKAFEENCFTDASK